MGRKDFIVVEYPGGCLDYPKELELPRIGEHLSYVNDDTLKPQFHNLEVLEIKRKVWVKNIKTCIKSTMTEVIIVVGERVK